MASGRTSLPFLLLLLAHVIHAASVSTSTPSPPLQWINLTSLLSGSSPPPLKDASIGYNEGSRTLLIFGGESESGVPQSQTYLLNLDTLTWSLPSPPSGIGGTPPARSGAISGNDFAASYRTGHLIAGGTGANGAALSDIWEFDYINQFWAQVNVQAGGPSVIAPGGGIDDINVPFSLNGSLPTNTFYAFGGSSNPVSLSDAWQLKIAGALSSNIVTGLNATWIKQSIPGSNPSVSGQGGTVNKQKLISFGGCENTASPSISCVTQDATIVDVSTSSTVSVPACVAPRLGPAIVSNRNTFSTSFATQAFVLLGTFNTSSWNDSGGLQQGEVDILDFGAATWTRVLPSGDPGTSGSKPTVPSPRAGAAAVSYSSGLVGGSRASYSDTIVFGGKDAAGNYYADVWLLRSYSGTVTPSNTKWTGFGSGTLQSGTNATGEGVDVQFLSTCVTALSQPSGTPTSSKGGASATQSSTSSAPPSKSASSVSNFHPYDTATSHKVLAPVSVAMLLPAIILYRLAQPMTQLKSPALAGSLGLQVISYAVAFVAFGIGLAGLILSFTTITATPQTGSSLFAKRAVSSSIILKTSHGQAGLALFILLYAVLPVVYIIYMASIYLLSHVHENDDDIATQRQHLRASSVDPTEKLNGASSPEGHQYDRSAATTPVLDAPTPSRRRHRSLTGSSFMASLRPTAERHSSESVALSEPSGPTDPSASGPHSFEVVNRPRKRLGSTTEGMTMSESSHRAAAAPTRRSLSDISWLDRRRSVNAVNEIDYALMQLHQQRGPPTPGTADLSTRALMNADGMPSDMAGPHMPTTTLTILHLFLHLLVLALSAFSLAALWERGPLAAFIVFLIWTVVLYVVLIALAWYGHPRESALTVFLDRLRGGHSRYQPASTPGPSRPLSAVGTEFPMDSRGPYMNQPLFRSAGQEDDYASPSRNGHAVDEGAESDEDEDTRQRRIEEEMQRRDVSIVTVPKRKLWITNPS